MGFVANVSHPPSSFQQMYSFSILLWELLTLEKAFSRMPVDEHREQVVKGKVRPELDRSWSYSLRDLLSNCWDRSPFTRPTAKEAYKTLRAEIAAKVAEQFPNQRVSTEEDGGQRSSRRSSGQK